MGNTLYNVDVGVEFSGPSAEALATVENNIFGQLNDPLTGEHIELDPSAYNARTVVQNNLFQDPIIVSSNCTDCLQDTPQFVNADVLDFRLQETSLAVDAGILSGVYEDFYDNFVTAFTALGSLEARDIMKGFDDTQRPINTTWDIGAFEFGEQNPPTDPPLPPGLVGRWLFDEGSGDSAADSTDTFAPGTLVESPTWTGGYLGNALQFAGKKDYVDLGKIDVLENQSQLTTCLWLLRCSEKRTPSESAQIHRASQNRPWKSNPQLADRTEPQRSQHKSDQRRPVASCLRCF